MKTTYFTPTPGAKPVPCEIIRQYTGGKLYIEIQNETHPITGKRLNWHNTDTYGCTELIHQSQIINP